MANQVVSLAYYVFRAKKAGASQEELSTVDVPYSDVLSQHVNLENAAELWSEMNEADDALVPLSEIDVAQTDYLDVVAQIFNAVSFRKLGG